MTMIRWTAILLTLAGGCATTSTKATTTAKPEEAKVAGIRAPSPDDPVDVRLRLGHFSSKDGIVGFVFDRADETAKLLFDGTKVVIDLQKQHGSLGRIDWARADGRTLLHSWPDGRMQVYIEGQAEPIAVRRDAVKREPLRRDQPPEVKVKLGHLASDDGMVGFVLDRRGEKAKLRFDGAKETVELTPQNGPFGRIDYARPDGGILLNLMPDGRATIYVEGRPDGLAVSRDSDADPL